MRRASEDINTGNEGRKGIKPTVVASSGNVTVPANPGSDSFWFPSLSPFPYVAPELSRGSSSKVSGCK